MERCPTQAVLPLVGLAAEKVIRDRDNGAGRKRRFAGTRSPSNRLRDFSPLRRRVTIT
ncbi:MAG: hypothetical protein R6U98_06115 [Pirellulaceae bacterium]